MLPKSFFCLLVVSNKPLLPLGPPPEHFCPCLVNLYAPQQMVVLHLFAAVLLVHATCPTALKAHNPCQIFYVSKGSWPHQCSPGVCGAEQTPEGRQATPHVLENISQHPQPAVAVWRVPHWANLIQAFCVLQDKRWCGYTRAQLAK